MKPGESPPLDANDEVSALIATLHETEQRLEELTAGEVDTVSDRDGRTFLMRRAQEQLRHNEAARQAESELRFRQIAENIREVFWLTDPAKNEILYISPAYEEIWGRSCASLYASPREWADAIHPDDRERVQLAARTKQAAGTYVEEYRIVHPDGAIRWIRDRAFPVLRNEREVYRIAGLAEDITEQKRAETRIKRLNRVYAVLSQINTLIVRAKTREELFREASRIAVEQGEFLMAWIGIVDRKAGSVMAVASAGDVRDFLESAPLGTIESSPDSFGLPGRAILEMIPMISNDVHADPHRMMKPELAERGINSLAVIPLLDGGQAIGVLALYSADAGFFDDEEMLLLQELAGDIAFAIDHIDKQERLDYLAYYDSLTGLANQSLFLERLQEKLLSARGDPRKKAVFVLDIERFKTINDAFGRHAGDELLKQIAERFVQIGGDVNRFARIGADRFAIAASDIDSAEQVGRYTEQKLGAFLGRPFRIGGSDLRISAKVGIALFPDDGADADTLLRHAEAALKKAKATGERYLFFTQAMTERIAERLSLENQLRQALDRGQFALHYQPKVSLASGRLTGAEALIRWNDPRTGLVPPGQFIPILEETGLIHEVGRWALRKAVEDHLRWRTAGLAVVRLSVNVSQLQLRDRGFIDEIEHAVAVDPHAAAGLELEITESLIMEGVKQNIATLRAIRAMGITVAIDDFGTGFSSLSYLSKLPVDTLKIDRSFVIDMTVGAEGMALVSTIINLGHSLKLKVVAEGVETEEQSRLLRSLNCDEMQGFLFSKPLPSEIFETRYLAAPDGR